MHKAFTELLLKAGINSQLKSVTDLHAHASYRSYHRLFTEDGKSFVVMKMPEGKASASEEITNFAGVKNELSFLNVQRFLEAHNVPVPKVFATNDHQSLLLLEDIGSDELFQHVIGANEEEREKWYAKALQLLISLQEHTQQSEATSCYALQRSFDAELLQWECDHFLEFALEARGVRVSAEAKNIFHAQTKKLTEAIIKTPYTFTHRDFQSRNLMVRSNGELVLIDFQDALMGPRVYDLVALTRDSYITLSDALVEKLISTFAQARKWNEAEIKREYLLVTLQRKLKDTGRFVYIDQVKGNPSFLQHIPRSLGYIKWALEQLPEYADLYKMLKQHVPEWK